MNNSTTQKIQPRQHQPLELDDEFIFSPPDAMMKRFSTGSPTKDDLKRIQFAAKNWLDSNGKISLERCLHLPASPEKYRIIRRNHFLSEAIKRIPEKSKEAAANRLEREWNEFIVRGLWRRCRDDATPPAGTGELSRCLFFATRFNRGETLKAKQIKRITGHIFQNNVHKTQLQ